MLEDEYRDIVEADLHHRFGVELLQVWRHRSTRWLLVRLRALYNEDTRTRRVLTASAEQDESEPDEGELDEELDDDE